MTKITMYEDDEVIDEMNMKQWVSLVDGNGKVRAEVISSTGEKAISTNDGKKLITYDEKSNTAIIATISDDVDTLLEMSLKEQTMKTLESLNKTHDVENLGEEEINGVKTYHLKGTPKKGDGIIGEQEIWVDVETWIPIKLISDGLGHKIETEVIKFDVSLKIDEILFVQEVPENAKIIDVDDNQFKEEIVTMKELTEKMEKQLLYVPESLGYELRQIKVYKFNKEDKGAYDEATQEYFKDGINKFSIYTIKQKFDLSEKELLPGEKEVDIRETKGHILDDFMRRISFQEDGIQYTLHIQDDNMKIEEAIKIIENMISYK